MSPRGQPAPDRPCGGAAHVPTTSFGEGLARCERCQDTFVQHASGRYRLCPDCRGEGADPDLLPVDRYMANRSGWKLGAGWPR